MSMNTDLVPAYDDLLHSQIVIDNIEKKDSTLNHIQLHIVHTKYVCNNHNHITSLSTITTLMN